MQRSSNLLLYCRNLMLEDSEVKKQNTTVIWNQEKNVGEDSRGERSSCKGQNPRKRTNSQKIARHKTIGLMLIKFWAQIHKVLNQDKNRRRKLTQTVLGDLQKLELWLYFKRRTQVKHTLELKSNDGRYSFCKGKKINIG